ncbi:gilatoxin-like [Elgaria multicarinata webbii]|uniref:gilatoxin-like n=1 Tax=Elgaria multicarinata webbii TaxID=159646 RepID=UPI002FCD4580
MEPSKLLAFFLLLLPPFVSAHRKRVLGGEECSESEHPWLVMLHNSKVPFCAGMLLDSNWVISAAHCYRSRRIVIKLGMHNTNALRGDEQSRVSAATLCYPDTESTTQNSCASYDDDDIMMIKLNRPVKYSKFIAPLRLPNVSVSVGAKCRVMGWGSTTAPKLTYPDVPHCADINIQEKHLCVKAYPAWKMTDHILCAGLLNGCKGACWGDSGGPLICDGQLQGIVTNGEPPGLSIFTKVDSYLNWIRGFY